MINGGFPGKHCRAKSAQPSNPADQESPPSNAELPMTEFPPDQTRREFLSRSGYLVLGSTLALSGLPRAACSSDEVRRHKRPLKPDTFKQHLAGPILSLPTTFTADLKIDLQAVKKMVSRARRYHVPIFELTAGNSKYALLSDDEINQVTRAMVTATDGDGLTIAATGAWPTEQVIEYARFCESIGADALQILLPAGVEAEDELVRHFETIASRTHLPLVLHGQYSLALLRRLIQIESIVAMKEDGHLTDYIDRAIEFGDRLEIFSGGAENRYLVGYPYGCRSFFATYTGFAPDIPMKFWAEIREGNLRRAVEINKKYDHPFIQRFSHPFWHATLEYFGVAGRHLRQPFQSFTDDNMKDVKTFFDSQGINPEDYIRTDA
jgi:dihydrodipicolinate synthase/N-acetylneuraminate lyase